MIICKDVDFFLAVGAMFHVTPPRFTKHDGTFIQPLRLESKCSVWRVICRSRRPLPLSPQKKPDTIPYAVTGGIAIGPLTIAEWIAMKFYAVCFQFAIPTAMPPSWLKLELLIFLFYLNTLTTFRDSG